MPAHAIAHLDRHDYLSNLRDSVSLYLKVERGEYFPPDTFLHDRVRRELSAILGMMALLASMDARWIGTASSNQRRPGFVSIELAGGQIDAPYFLLGALPPRKLLLEIYRLGAELKAARGSTICLSGSACYAGTAKHFGDVDFCEYVPTNDSTLARGLLAAAEANSSQAYMFRFRVGASRWDRGSLNEWSALLRTLKNDPDALLSESAFRQSTHVTNMPSVGVLEATNVILIIATSHAQHGEGEWTFALQEAPLATDWIPKDLTDPLELGRYIAWVVRQIWTLVDESKGSPQYAVKAARRGLALARLLMMGDEATTMSHHLRNRNGGKIATLASRCALYAALSAQDDTVLTAKFLSDLRATIETIRGHKICESDSYGQLLPAEVHRLETYAKGIRDSLTSLVQRVQRELGSIPAAMLCK